jgi:hypothetical protein
VFAQQLELFDIIKKMRVHTLQFLYKPGARLPSTIAQILPFQLEILNRSEATLDNRENKLKLIHQIALNHGHAATKEET